MSKLDELFREMLVGIRDHMETMSGEERERALSVIHMGIVAGLGKVHAEGLKQLAILMGVSPKSLVTAIMVVKMDGAVVAEGLWLYAAKNGKKIDLPTPPDDVPDDVKRRVFEELDE